MERYDLVSRTYIMKKHTTGDIVSLYNKSISAAISDNNTSKWFQTNVRVCQGRILSTSLFNIIFFWEQTKTSALEGLSGTMAVGGRQQSLRFVDDIDLIAGSKEKLTAD